MSFYTMKGRGQDDLKAGRSASRRTKEMTVGEVLEIPDEPQRGDWVVWNIPTRLLRRIAGWQPWRLDDPSRLSDDTVLKDQGGGHSLLAPARLMCLLAGTPC